MNRIQFFEFNERNECPEFIRDGIVELLGKGIRWGKYFDNSIQTFIQFANKVDTTIFLDLCSGSGEPAEIFIDGLIRHGVNQFKFVLSDLFPKIHAMEEAAKRYPEHIDIITQSIDATDVNSDFDQAARTIINAFHHFPPNLAKNIIRDCVIKKRGLFIIESFPRSVLRFLSILPYLAVSYIANPFITKKDRFLKLFFSFIIPVIPVLGTFDGFISALRIHSKDDLFSMVDEWKHEYDFEYHELPFFPFGRVVIFTGVPKKSIC